MDQPLRRFVLDSTATVLDLGELLERQAMSPREICLLRRLGIGEHAIIAQRTVMRVA